MSRCRGRSFRSVFQIIIYYIFIICLSLIESRSSHSATFNRAKLKHDKQKVKSVLSPSLSDYVSEQNT